MEWTDLKVGDVCSITFIDVVPTQLISEVTSKTDITIIFNDVISSEYRYF